MSWMNEAGWDRFIRVVAGLLLAYIPWAGYVAGGLGLAVGLIGFVLLVTGIVGFCPLYRVLGVRTNRPATPGGTR